MISLPILIMGALLLVLVLIFVWAMIVIGRMAKALAFYCAEKGDIERATLKALFSLIIKIWRRK